MKGEVQLLPRISCWNEATAVKVDELVAFCPGHVGGARKSPENVRYLDLLIVSENKVGYGVGQGFISRNASRNMHRHVKSHSCL